MQQARLSDDGQSGRGIEIPAHSTASRQRFCASQRLDPSKECSARHRQLAGARALEALVQTGFGPRLSAAGGTDHQAGVAWIAGRAGHLAVLVARQVFSPLRLNAGCSEAAEKYRYMRLALEYALWGGLLLSLGFALQLGSLFPRRLIWTWLALTPVCLIVADYGSTRSLARAHAAHERHIIIGANEVGLELARRISQNQARALPRLLRFPQPRPPAAAGAEQWAGPLRGGGRLCPPQRRRCDLHRAADLQRAAHRASCCSELRDTTASIYFVPDYLRLRPGAGALRRDPRHSGAAVCDTPFHGMRACASAPSTSLLALLPLLVRWPLMLLIAARGEAQLRRARCCSSSAATA